MSPAGAGFRFLTCPMVIRHLIRLIIESGLNRPKRLAARRPGHVDSSMGKRSVPRSDRSPELAPARVRRRDFVRLSGRCLWSRRGGRFPQALEQEDQDDGHDVEHGRNVEEIDLRLGRVAADGLPKARLVLRFRRALAYGRTHCVRAEKLTLGNSGVLPSEPVRSASIT